MSSEADRRKAHERMMGRMKRQAEQSGQKWNPDAAKREINRVAERVDRQGPLEAPKREGRPVREVVREVTAVMNIDPNRKREI